MCLLVIVCIYFLNIFIATKDALHKIILWESASIHTLLNSVKLCRELIKDFLENHKKAIFQLQLIKMLK